MDVIEGRFESIPLESASIDYLYSVLAFHWTTDLEASADINERSPFFVGNTEVRYVQRYRLHGDRKNRQ